MQAFIFSYTEFEMVHFKFIKKNVHTFNFFQVVSVRCVYDRFIDFFLKIII